MSLKLEGLPGNGILLYSLGGTKTVTIETFFCKRLDVNNNEKAKGNCKKITVIEEKRITFIVHLCSRL